MPQFDKPFAVHVDASDVVIGAVLTQQHDGVDMPVYYFSRQLNATESRWSIYEQELYALV